MGKSDNGTERIEFDKNEGRAQLIYDHMLEVTDLKERIFELERELNYTIFRAESLQNLLSERMDRVVELSDAYMEIEDERDDLIIERWTEEGKLKKRIGELEAFIEQLIEAGDRLTANPELYNYEEAEQSWTKLWLSWKKQKESKK